MVQRDKQGQGRTVRSERYRYTEWFGDPKQAELYDHQTDPNELTNLANEPDHRQTLEEMRRLLQDGWQKARPQ